MKEVSEVTHGTVLNKTECDIYGCKINGDMIWIAIYSKQVGLMRLQQEDGYMEILKTKRNQPKTLNDL